MGKEMTDKDAYTAFLLGTFDQRLAMMGDASVAAALQEQLGTGPVEDYRRQMRVRSPRWGTVGLPGAVFRELVRPFRDFTECRGLPALARAKVDA